MRIGFDVSYIQTKRAGAGRYALELLKLLLATDADNEYILHGWSFSLDQRALHSLARTGVTMRTRRVPGNLKRFAWDHVGVLPLRYLTGPIDVFHSCDAFLPALGNIKGIATVHDVCQRLHPEYFETKIHSRDHYLRRALESAAAIVVPSRQTQTDLQAMFSVPGEKIHLVYPPLPRCFHPAGPQDITAESRLRDALSIHAPFVLFVGTLEPRKNVVSLIRAFENADRILAGTRSLVIAGKPGWMYRDIFHAIEASPSRRKIHYLRYVSEEDLATLYRLAHVFVYPSYYEGFGYPVFEAMASGTPVVTSDSSSLKELTGGAAVLTDPSDQASIAGAIVEVSRNEDRRRELIDAGLQRAGWLASQNPATQILKIYRMVASH